MSCDPCVPLECWRVRETGKVYCLYANEMCLLHVVEVDFEETSLNDLPESLRKTIQELEQQGGGG